MYVKGLVEELGKLGVENVVAAPAARRSDMGNGIWEEGGNKIRVWRFVCRESGGDLGEIYGKGDPVAAENFKKVLNAEKPDIVHFHAWSPAVSILLVREVKRRGIRLVQTYHTPTLSCPRGTLMRWGKTVCDGDLAKRPCVACAVQGKAQSLWANKSRTEMPDAGCRMPGALPRTSPNPKAQSPNPKRSKILILASKLKTMFRMPSLIRNRAKAVEEMFRSLDAMVALNDWSRKLLELNGVENSRIRLIRHGIPAPSMGEQMPESGCQTTGAGGALKLVFLGRVAQEKGIGVLLEAIRLVRTKVELEIYGIRTEGDRGERIEVRGNARIRWLQPVKPEQVVETIQKYDALVVPSVWLETGPLVVLEAFAAGVPVIGSRLGGIAEMVRDGVDGLLFHPGNPADLAEKLDQLPERIGHLKKGVRPPRDNQEVAKACLEMYRLLK